MVNNPRFPHYVKVLRAVKDEFGNIVFDENGQPTYTQIHESSCGIRNQSGNVRTTKDAIDADFKLSLPRHSVNIKEGDLCELTTFTDTIHLTVLRALIHNFGANIWASKTAN